MKRVFVKATIMPGKFDKSQTHWPTDQGWSAQVETAFEDIRTDGSRLYINEDLSYQHYDFGKVWQWVAQTKMECDDVK